MDCTIGAGTATSAAKAYVPVVIVVDHSPAAPTFISVLESERTVVAAMRGPPMHLERPKGLNDYSYTGARA